MSGFIPNNNSSNSRWGTAVAKGFKNAGEQTNQRVRMLNEYHQALEKKDTFERQQKKEKYDLAKQALNTLSESYPVGNDKSDKEYAMFRLQQPEAYKALVQHIKEGMPWAVENGNIIRIPKWQAAQNRIKHDQSVLEQKVQQGTATPSEKLEYAQKHFWIKAQEKAQKVVEDNVKNGVDGYKDLNHAQISDKISEMQNVFMNSAVSSLGNTGAIPNEQQPQVQGQPQSGVNPYVQALGFPISAVAQMLQGNQGPANISVPQNQNAEALQVPAQQPDVQNPQGTVPRIPQYKVIK